MRLTIDPIPTIPQFNCELEIVILITQDRLPEVFGAEDLPRPDRHFLLGLVQTAAMAIGEQDPESVVFVENCSMQLDRAGESKDVAAGLAVVKNREGRFGTLVVGDWTTAGRLARQAVRWFTGTVRLDVP
jgi:hypothetical protein